MEKCTIIGDSDIVGPGVRFSVYLQCITILIKILADEDEILESVKLGALTSFSLILSALISDLNYVLLLEVSKFVSILTLTSIIMTLQSPLFIIKNFENVKNFKNTYSTILLCLIANLTALIYNVWLFTVLKWKLPKEECGDQVKFYFYAVPVNPIGGFRIFMLIMSYITSIYLSIWLISLIIAGFVYRKEINFIRKVTPDSGSEGSKVLTRENPKKKKGRMFFILPMAVEIVSTELSVQRNSISGIWDWGFGQILAMVLAVLDLLRTFIVVYRIICDMFEKLTTQDRLKNLEENEIRRSHNWSNL
ncbi:unnamed protein product [Rhizophagus irregularis]|uniref:Uncharacterized protein n=1 Tax=Rhizophagus irregularis TaxID=588596 RepID=A0A2N1P153_9GLOM|nr:hypothetical protein RhiirC2_704744 [Rhizophagus irregularis]CAB4388800.1 unnamed protein product [Rhizophagus irregularis]CAB5356396.1 unnamed protein product [Rhizophagus irregularis]